MSKAQISIHLAELRAEMEALELDGFYVPRADQFQNEYVPPCNSRLEFITGFSGSAGLAIILKDTAAFFTDGRYTLQASEEVPADSYEIYSTAPGQAPTPTMKPTDWLDDKLPEGSRLGFDPWIITPMQYDQLNSSVALEHGHLIPVESNLIDKIWGHRPAAPQNKMVAHPVTYAGLPHDQKIKDMTQKVVEANCEALILCYPEEIAWLLNIRGSDVDFNPLCLCYAILQASGTVDLFIDSAKVTDDIKTHLGSKVHLHAFEDFEPALHALKDGQKTIWFDPDTVPFMVKYILEHDHITFHEEESPIQMAKACKNETEQKGTVSAHIRDGVALTRFLAKLSQQSYAANTSELSAANDLRHFREEEDLFKDLSFDTISGAGPAGAIIHYRVTEDSDKPLTSGPLYLVDSGGQYLDGTTDVTRTVAVDTPSDEMRENFTRVLKGHIQVAMSRFTKGTTGAPIDNKARKPLNDVGLDYAHGTGHGVGSYLCVHEGPCGIHSRSRTPLLPGMVLSNEPGYYKPGSYGIRIENLVMVIETDQNKDGKPVYGFQNLTLAPIDINCIKTELLSEDEKNWLNTYHQTVRETLTPLIEEKDPEAAAWLKTATKPL